MPFPPIDPRFVRKLSLLCCHFSRNVAYFRMVYVNEDGSGILKHATQFGATVNGNMLDIAVLEWCKLFADRNARHHWRRFVRAEAEQNNFIARLLQAANIKSNDWKRYLDEMRVYRDKFVAHLDDQNVMRIPSLDIALECVFFLYEHVLAHAPAGTFVTPHCANLPHDLRDYYAGCQMEAQIAYGP